MSARIKRLPTAANEFQHLRLAQYVLWETVTDTAVGAEAQMSTTAVTKQVRTEVDIEKLVAFIRVGARRMRFNVAPELLDALLQRLEDFARRNRVRLAVEFVHSDRTKTLRFGVSGAAVGATIGAALGGPNGAVVGAVAGAACGVLVAHTKLRISFGDVEPVLELV